MMPPDTSMATEAPKRPRGRPRKTVDERDDGNRRHALLSAAAELFRRKGFAATTTRDIAGTVGDYFSQPRVLGFLARPSAKKSILARKLKLGTYGTIITVVNGLDERSRADADLVRIRKQSVDPYATLRAYYLQNRAGEIAKLKAKDGEEPHLPAGEDPLADPLADPLQVPAQPAR